MVMEGHGIGPFVVGAGEGRLEIQGNIGVLVREGDGNTRQSARQGNGLDVAAQCRPAQDGNEVVPVS